jgi:dTDP-4-amino-4,6-dideoxygalactose transaminase
VRVPFNDLAADPGHLVEEELQEIERVVRSGWWILGDQVASFEREWADYCGAHHAVGVGNGMDALVVGMLALGIGPGDEVITSPMTAFATALAIVRTGATPVLADINVDTAMITPESVERCISPSTKAVILVHLYGQAGPAAELALLCSAAGIALIEDCAQAHGASTSAIPVGSVGAFAAWSFYPTKNLGAIGDAGSVTTNSAELAERCRRLRNYGQSVRYEHPELGLNSRLDEIQAAILRRRLPHLDGWNATRKRVADTYTAHIRHPGIRILPAPPTPNRHVHHLYVVTCQDRDELRAHLAAAEVDSLCHYPIPVHRQPSATTFRLDPAGLRVAERHASTCLSIPCHPHLTSQQVDHVIGAMNGFLGGAA